ncbi:MAG: glutamate-5-semialdehyde dehydrogenase [Ruminococcaceae bacterium]|nr:glutamate-5-semialdehyde dehydrogenase [Oscillospiraceae bacterium]
MSIQEDVRALCLAAREAVPSIANTDGEARNRALLAMSAALRARTAEILAANEDDLSRAEENGVPRVMLDRLRLSAERICGIATAMEALCALPDPLARSESWQRPSGLSITRQSVPLGVVAIIYEARPNVTADAAALCIKSGNAVVLRGGKEAIATNRAIVTVLQEAIAGCGIDPNAISLVTSTSRESADALLQMRGLVDALIPRGGKGLIQNCVENAKIPVIETGAGNCHVYVDAAANLDKALRVAVNAKCQRPSVCNAAESLLVHRDIAEAFLPRFAEATRPWQVELRGCPRTCAILPSAKPATEEDYLTEYNDFVMSVLVVDGLDEAIAHINRTGTGHSEAILTEDTAAAARFMQHVDAAAVYHNASTRFTDGGEFGFGAEIGISTQKLHARGPMGLEALTTVKYMVTGDGTVRE